MCNNASLMQKDVLDTEVKILNNEMLQKDGPVRFWEKAEKRLKFEIEPKNSLKCSA